MKAVALIFGVLLLLGGGAVAGAQFVPVDLSFLSSVPGAQEFLKTQNALYAGGGAAGLGFILFIVGLIPGGKKEKPAKAAPAAKPAPAPKAAAPAPKPAAAPKAEPKPESKKEPKKETAKASTPKPVASSTPPKSAQAKPAAAASGDAPTWMQDPRLVNRKRVSDLVAMNDAIKAYHAKNGKYPAADKLGGFLDRGKAWIPGLSPEFIPELPRDPANSDSKDGPQYLYVSNGSDYKLVVKGVSLVGGTNVEVLGVRFDPSRQNTTDNAAFGFWTQGFESFAG